MELHSQPLAVVPLTCSSPTVPADSNSLRFPRITDQCGTASRLTGRALSPMSQRGLNVALLKTRCAGSLGEYNLVCEHGGFGGAVGSQHGPS